MGIDSDPTIENPREQAARELEEAKNKQYIAMKKGVPRDKHARDYVKVGERIFERPGLEKMKLDILAGLQTIKDALGISDFARASKEVERLEKQLREMDKMDE